jgi:DNA-binding NtrC family response regulator
MENREPASTAGRVACDVVVVDDFQDLAVAIAEALRRGGLSTRMAFNAEEAVRLARTCVPSVALVDCVLPDADGFDLIRGLGEAWPDTIFIAMSGDVGGISEDTARQLRIRAFLNKPVPMRPLTQAVERMVRTCRTRSMEDAAPRAWISLGIGSPSRPEPPSIVKSRCQEC